MDTITPGHDLRDSELRTIMQMIFGFGVFVCYWFYLAISKILKKVSIQTVVITFICECFISSTDLTDKLIPTFQYRFSDHQLIFHFLCYVQSPIELLAVFLLGWRILLCDPTATHCNVQIFVFYQGDMLSPIKQYISPSVHGPSLKAYSVEISSLWVVKSW